MQATLEAYLQHVTVTKARVVELVHEVAGAEVAGPLVALKKDAAVAQAELLLAGRGWLPACLRRQPVPEATDGKALRSGVTKAEAPI